MARAWQTLATVPTAEGALDLRQRGDDEFLILIAGRVLMTSAARRSEEALATLACARLEGRPAPRVLIGGLGMGYTLRAALDALPPAAKVAVVELTPPVVAWCRGPLADLAGRVLEDPRVDAIVGDVFAELRRRPAGFDAVALDLWQGPYERNDPVFTTSALAACRGALRPGGRLVVWSEQSVGGFEGRLTAAGFVSPHKHVAKRGFRHVNYTAEVPESRPHPQPRR